MAENNRINLQFLGNHKIETQSTFSILCEGQNQILQIAIPPNCSNYIRGKMVYANISSEPIPRLIKWNPFTPGIKMHLWRNRSQQMEIVGLTHLDNRGPILILDASVYKESLFINQNYIVAAKYTLEKNIVMHPHISSLQLVEFKEKATSLQEFFKNNQKIALQASSPIIEKYLGFGEPFCLHSGEILAISQTMQVEKINNAIKLTGPGWVFFQTPKQQSSKISLCISIIPILILVLWRIYLQF